MLHDILEHDHKQWHPPLIRYFTNSWPCYRQGYVKERKKSSLRKFYGRYGDLIKHYKVPLSQMLHDILGHDHIHWHCQLIRHYTNLWTYYRSGPYYRFYYRFWRYYLIPEGFHRAFAKGSASQQRTLTPPDTWFCPFSHSFPNLSCQRTFLPSKCPTYIRSKSRKFKGVLKVKSRVKKWQVRKICT